MPSLLEGASSSLLPCLEGGSSAPARALQRVAALGAPLILARLRAGTPEARAARASDGRHLRVRVRVRVSVSVRVRVRVSICVSEKITFGISEDVSVRIFEEVSASI